MFVQDTLCKYAVSEWPSGERSRLQSRGPDSNPARDGIRLMAAWCCIVELSLIGTFSYLYINSNCLHIMINPNIIHLLFTTDHVRTRV